MATITVTRSLPAFVGVFNVNTFEFTISEDVIPTVTIAGVAFSPMKTGNDNGVDTYVMDVTNILKYVIGLPPLDKTIPSALSASCVIAISGAEATTVNISTILFFAVDKLGELSVENVYAFGRNEPIYHNGTIMFYNMSSVTGSTVCSIGTVNINYNIYSGWNSIALNQAHLINGKFLVTGTNIDLTLVYLDPSSLNTPIDWINRDGCWSSTYFRRLSKNLIVEKTNDIPIYNSQHFMIIGNNRNISANKNVSINYDIVAKNADHYRLLCEIADSPVVLIENKILATVTNISQDIAECRQNLHFVLTLQYQDYVANY